MQSIDKMIEKIRTDYESGLFLNYIKYIQFPKYKNLEKDVRIDFSFPLTMLVGKNGTGKSSVLHAIYGMPMNRSTGEYWFATDVDPIVDAENCYFYGYQKDKNAKIKEVLKKRQPSTKAIDYWETAALNTKLGMQPDFDLDRDSRNAPVEKEVIYFDFRGELSAFDKYFHFYKSKNDKLRRKFEQKRGESKGYIQRKSGFLNRIFSGEKRVAYPQHPENILHDNMEVISENNGRNILKEINEILGKKYIEIRRVYHRVYESWGTSVKVKNENGMTYSEANAGSGESAIINMVCAIVKAPHNSLILLDEPEVSLHPSAQKKLKFFLLNAIKKYHHQVIISTHSIILIEDMPKEALILLEENECGKVKITNNVFYKEAFFNIKEEVLGKNLIICEDSSAKILLECVLHKMQLNDYFSVEYRHGGADTLVTKYLPIFALDREIYDNVFLFLDGDKEPEKRVLYSELSVGEAEDVDILKECVKNLTTSRTEIPPLIDGRDKEGNLKQKKDVFKMYLQFAEEHLYFLPNKMIPEAIVLSEETVRESADHNYSEVTNQNAKNILKKIADILYTGESCKDACMNMLSKTWSTNIKNAEYIKMCNMLNGIYEYCNKT